jgi:hypothetical protein
VASRSGCCSITSRADTIRVPSVFASSPNCHSMLVAFVAPGTIAIDQPGTVALR